MRELALFAGAGGGILGGVLLGWRTVCAVELDDYCRRLLVARQDDGHLAPFPVWDDVRTFDGRPWRGRVDVISGGFPCQDISSAGKRAGIDGARSGLWREFARIIEETAPRFVFIENSPHLRHRGLVRVLKDLARMGYDAKWCVLGADDVGAPHRRKRIWIAGYANGERQRHAQHEPPIGTQHESAPCDTDDGRQRAPELGDDHEEREWWPLHIVDPRVDDGLAHRMDRIRATGNGQVPAVAALAWRTLGVEREGGQDQ